MFRPQSSPDLDPETANLPPGPGSGEKFILFELGGRRFGVAASAVAEVVHPMSVAVLPNSPKWLLGLSPYRGEPVAVIDPRTIAGGEYKSGGHPKTKTVVFRAKSTETQFALPVDNLLEMLTIAPPDTPPAGNVLIDHVHDELPLTVIAHKALFAGFSETSR